MERFTKAATAAKSSEFAARKRSTRPIRDSAADTAVDSSTESTAMQVAGWWAG